MNGYLKLPDGSVFPVEVAKDGVPDVDDQLTASPRVDAMEGRDLDAAVAVRVFGFTVEWRTNKRTGAQEPLYQLGNSAWVVVPYYSERMAPSITLGLQLQDLGWKQTSALRDSHVTLVHTDGRTVSATGQTQGEALARAAIKASGQGA